MDRARSDAIHRYTIGGLVLALCLISSAQASAHAMTFRNVQTATECINANQSASVHMYSSIPLTDKTWVVQTRIGLSSGNTVQFVTWESFAQGGSGNILADARGAVSEWVSSSGYPEAATLPFHSNGEPDVWFSIFNNDPVSQCFDLYALAAHY